MNSSRSPNKSPLSEETDQPEKNILSEFKRQIESFTSLVVSLDSHLNLVWIMYDYLVNFISIVSYFSQRIRFWLAYRKLFLLCRISFKQEPLVTKLFKAKMAEWSVGPWTFGLIVKPEIVWLWKQWVFMKPLVLNFISSWPNIWHHYDSYDSRRSLKICHR